MRTNKEKQKTPSEAEAKAYVAKMNDILKSVPLGNAVLDREYNRLLRQVHAGGRWGVLVGEIKMIDGKPWGDVRLVSTDADEYIEMFGEGEEACFS